MKLYAVCTNRTVRQGSIYDLNDQPTVGTVIDLRFTPKIDVSPTAQNRQTFGGMPAGDFTLTGLLPAVANVFTLGTEVEVEVTVLGN